MSKSAFFSLEENESFSQGYLGQFVTTKNAFLLTPYKSGRKNEKKNRTNEILGIWSP